MLLLKGKIIVNDVYEYEGFIKNNSPHGIGKVIFQNGDVYEGSFRVGKIDGYGKYDFKTLSMVYTGFFTGGVFNGIGTIETSEYIMKGCWIMNKRNGFFTITDKKRNLTVEEEYISGELKNRKGIQYKPPELLMTFEKNPKNKTFDKLIECKKKIKKKQKFKSCCLCCEKNSNATNSCGHVCACYECLIKCSSCPICKSEIKNVIKLYF